MEAVNSLLLLNLPMGLKPYIAPLALLRCLSLCDLCALLLLLYTVHIHIEINNNVLSKGAIKGLPALTTIVLGI